MNRSELGIRAYKGKRAFVLSSRGKPRVRALRPGRRRKSHALRIAPGAAVVIIAAQVAVTFRTTIGYFRRRSTTRGTCLLPSSRLPTSSFCSEAPPSMHSWPSLRAGRVAYRPVAIAAVVITATPRGRKYLRDHNRICRRRSTTVSRAVKRICVPDCFWFSLALTRTRFRAFCRAVGDGVV